MSKVTQRKRILIGIVSGILILFLYTILISSKDRVTTASSKSPYSSEISFTINPEETNCTTSAIESTVITDQTNCIDSTIASTTIAQQTNYESFTKKTVDTVSSSTFAPSAITNSKTIYCTTTILDSESINNLTYYITTTPDLASDTAPILTTNATTSVKECVSTFELHSSTPHFYSDTNEESFVVTTTSTDITTVTTTTTSILITSTTTDTTHNNVSYTNTVTIETTTYGLQENSILLPTEQCPIEIAIVPATQSNVDMFDIVQDNGELFSTETDLFFFGHIYKSFISLDQIVTNEKIIVWNNSIPETYTVVVSSPGRINSSNTDITDDKGNSLLFNTVNSPCIRLITCRYVLDTGDRWVVIATKD